MRLSSLVFGIICAVVVIGVLLSLSGVSFHGPNTLQGSALYNSANEVSVSGVVTAVDQFDCPVSEGELGTHLMLNTGDGTLQIHLAPARILSGQNLSFSVGDKIQVVGAKVKLMGKNGIIARELTRGNEIYIFRDPTGKLLMTQ